MAAVDWGNPRLASPDFAVRVKSDRELQFLAARLYDRRRADSVLLESLDLTGGVRIGRLPILPLTAAKWAFLWLLDNPLVSGDPDSRVSVIDLDVFLWVLCQADLRKLRMNLSAIPSAAAGYARATGLSADRTAKEINEVISAAFSPLAALPREESAEPVCFDALWLARVAAAAVRESGLNFDEIVHCKPLSLVCTLYVVNYARESADGNKVRRPDDPAIRDAMDERLEQLAAEELAKCSDKCGNQ